MSAIAKEEDKTERHVPPPTHHQQGRECHQHLEDKVDNHKKSWCKQRRQKNSWSSRKLLLPSFRPPPHLFLPLPHTHANTTTAMSPRPSDDLRISQEDWFKVSKVAAGGFTFVLALSGFQCMQGLARISAAHPLASALGLISVGTGSVMASLVADKAPATVCEAVGWAPPTHWTRKITSGKDLLSPQKCSSLWQDPDQKEEEQILRVLRAAMMGIVIFKGFGGRFFSTAPSDVARPGAFFRMKGSLPATYEYARRHHK